MIFVLTQYLSQTLTSALCEFEFFAARLNNPSPQNVKTVFLGLWPDLDPKRDLYIKMLNMRYVRLDVRFQTPPRPSRYNA